MPRRQADPDFDQGSPGETVINGSNKWKPSKTPSFKECNCSWEQYCGRTCWIIQGQVFSSHC